MATSSANVSVVGAPPRSLLLLLLPLPLLVCNRDTGSVDVSAQIPWPLQWSPQASGLRWQKSPEKPGKQEQFPRGAHVPAPEHAVWRTHCTTPAADDGPEADASKPLKRTMVELPSLGLSLIHI